MNAQRPGPQLPWACLGAATGLMAVTGAQRSRVAANNVGSGSSTTAARYYQHPAYYNIVVAATSFTGSSSFAATSHTHGSLSMREGPFKLAAPEGGVLAAACCGRHAVFCALHYFVRSLQGGGTIHAP